MCEPGGVTSMVASLAHIGHALTTTALLLFIHFSTIIVSQCSTVAVAHRNAKLKKKTRSFHKQIVESFKFEFQPE